MNNRNFKFLFKDLAQSISRWDQLKQDILSLGDDLVSEGLLIQFNG